MKTNDQHKRKNSRPVVIAALTVFLYAAAAFAVCENRKADTASTPEGCGLYCSGVCTWQSTINTALFCTPLTGYNCVNVTFEPPKYINVTTHAGVCVSGGAAICYCIQTSTSTVPTLEFGEKTTVQCGGS